MSRYRRKVQLRREELRDCRRAREMKMDTPARVAGDRTKDTWKPPAAVGWVKVNTVLPRFWERQHGGGDQAFMRTGYASGLADAPRRKRRKLSFRVSDLRRNGSGNQPWSKQTVQTL
jgi:hypothetical protein